MCFSLSSHENVDTAALRRAMARPDAGGFVVFEGWVRDHHLGKAVASLTYEAYEPLALKEGRRVVDETLARFDILEARAVHCLGALHPGDLAVWVAVSAAHRGDAFEACRWLIDAIKARVPVWKHEFYADGTDEWVDPTSCHCAQHPHPHPHHHEGSAPK